MEEVACAEASVPVCRHWQRMGFCLYGEGCRFRHPTGDVSWMTNVPAGAEPAPQEASTAAEHRRQAFAKLSNERHKNRGDGRRNKIMNRSKAGSFRRWLEDTFGLAMLRTGTGVLDVAGGKGELSFELTNLTGVHTTVVDPRPLRLDRYIKRLLVGIYHRTGPLQAYNHLPIPAGASQVLRPGHLRTFFDDALLRVLDQHDQGDVEKAAEAFSSGLAAAQAVAWTEKGLVEETGGNEQTTQQPEDAGIGDVVQGIVDWSVAQEVLMQCSLIVGLHPDQATEAIVDFALRWNKGFAIVPCCVYHKQFPRRRLNGKAVTTYDQFVAYLIAKDPERIKLATLDFEGKNTVLYALPIEDDGARQFSLEDNT